MREMAVHDARNGRSRWSETTVHDAAKSAFTMGRRMHIRHLPVVQAGILLGIVSDRDVLARATLCKDGSLDVPADPVALAMTAAPITCEPTTTVADLARIMTERKIDAVPVMRRSRMVGPIMSAA